MLSKLKKNKQFYSHSQRSSLSLKTPSEQAIDVNNKPYKLKNNVAYQGS